MLLIRAKASPIFSVKYGVVASVLELDAQTLTLKFRF